MNARLAPRATYRLQLNHTFTFDQARQVVPYLAALGISHVYASPCLKARAGSLHGYDIVDHHSLNPEMGSQEDFGAFVDALHAQGMGLILDWVPNHMGIGCPANTWWLDVLENGQASPYAAYFDIDWHPIRESLRGKVLLPVLGDHYGKVLENGELRLEFDPQHGEFHVRYYERRLPLDPETYPDILARSVERLAALPGEEGHVLIEWHGLIASFEQLRASRSAPLERARAAAACKQRLAALHQQSPSVQAFVGEQLAAFEGWPGQPDSFDALHALLERQSFQLASWRVASDEINYRRFFDINDLACLRQENPDVFEATHRLILALITDGSVDGLRVDHPDGLYDPGDYFRRLQTAASRALDAAAAEPNGDAERPLYLAAEKILAGYEHLREGWRVTGTTGYEFANLVNGLFIQPGAERELTRLYRHHTGQDPDFDPVLYHCKRQIIRSDLSSELNTLVNLLSGIAQADRSTRDFTVNGLRDALTEVVAYFPVYRTYITAHGASEEDRRFVAWAVAQAKKRSPDSGAAFFEFIQSILLLDKIDAAPPEQRARIVRFAMKFQQYTAPVMAKGMEDTAFYIYNRLVSLNEVGGDPRRFGVSLAAFHHANQQRLERWPESMLSISTHDSKRSGDVRARINLMTELAGEWRHAVARWRRLNRNKKLDVDGEPAPSRNDEYLLYQTLLGTWPLDPADLAGFSARIEAYMAKAVKEAKVHTSWTHPNEDYARATAEFAQALLDPKRSRVFLSDFLGMAQRVARLGCYNSLSQTLLLLTCPGVPDLYQGTELWRYTLVDPDNRQPVDFAARGFQLDELRQACREGAVPGLARRLLERIEEGRAKLFLIWKALSFRQAEPELFRRGEYLPLEAQGSQAERLCLFLRRRDSALALIVAPRWFAGLPIGPDQLPLGEAAWGDTRILMPAFAPDARLADILSGARLVPETIDGIPSLRMAEVLRDFPVALLKRDA